LKEVAFSEGELMLRNDLDSKELTKLRIIRISSDVREVIIADACFEHYSEACKREIDMNGHDEHFLARLGNVTDELISGCLYPRISIYLIVDNTLEVPFGRKGVEKGLIEIFVRDAAKDAC
jgi:hypothetical protein